MAIPNSFSVVDEGGDGVLGIDLKCRQEMDVNNYKNYTMALISTVDLKNYLNKWFLQMFSGEKIYGPNEIFF